MNDDYYKLTKVALVYTNPDYMEYEDPPESYEDDGYENEFGDYVIDQPDYAKLGKIMSNNNADKKAIVEWLRARSRDDVFVFGDYVRTKIDGTNDFGKSHVVGSASDLIDLRNKMEMNGYIIHSTNDRNKDIVINEKRYFDYENWSITNKENGAEVQLNVWIGEPSSLPKVEIKLESNIDELLISKRGTFFHYKNGFIGGKMDEDARAVAEIKESISKKEFTSTPYTTQETLERFRKLGYKEINKMSNEKTFSKMTVVDKLRELGSDRVYLFGDVVRAKLDGSADFDKPKLVATLDDLKALRTKLNNEGYSVEGFRDSNKDVKNSYGDTIFSYESWSVKDKDTGNKVKFDVWFGELPNAQLLIAKSEANIDELLICKSDKIHHIQTYWSGTANQNTKSTELIKTYINQKVYKSTQFTTNETSERLKAAGYSRVSDVSINLNNPLKDHRITMIQNVLNTGIKRDCDFFVFGEFVRDVIAGQYIDKLDIVLRTVDDVTRFRDAAVYNGYNIKFNKNIKFGDERDQFFTGEEWTLSTGGTNVTVNIHIGAPEHLKKLANYDADINSLKFGWGGDYRTLDDHYDIKEILANIKERVYTAPPNLKNDKKTRLTNKGYSNKANTKETEGKKEVTTMAETKKEESFFDMIKADGNKAAYRVAGTQMTKGTKAALLAALGQHTQNSEALDAIRSMLDTESGTAAISFLLGVTLTYLPMVKDDPRAKKLAEEFRVEGIATVGNEAIGFALQHMLPVITQALAALPPAEETNKVRVPASNEAPAKLQEAETEALATEEALKEQSKQAKSK